MPRIAKSGPIRRLLDVLGQARFYVHAPCLRLYLGCMDDAITKAIRELVREELQATKAPAPPPLEPVPPFRLYSTRSAAKLLDRSVDYVLDLIKSGQLNGVVDLGGSRAAYRIRADELQRFIESRTVTRGAARDTHAPHSS